MHSRTVRCSLPSLFYSSARPCVASEPACLAAQLTALLASLTLLALLALAAVLAYWTVAPNQASSAPPDKLSLALCS